MDIAPKNLGYTLSSIAWVYKDTTTMFLCHNLDMKRTDNMEALILSQHNINLT